MKKTRKKLARAAAVGGTLLAGSPALSDTPPSFTQSTTGEPGQTQPSHVPAEHSPLTKDELKVLNELHYRNRAEVEMAGVADANAGDANVKQFGNLTVTDHERLEERVTNLARKHGATLSTEMVQMTPTMEGLRKVKGPEFDRSFMTAMLAAHDQAIRQFTTALGVVKATDLQQLVNDTLAVLKMHRNIAEGWVNTHKAQARTSPPTR
jgi:putative membrane protein